MTINDKIRQIAESVCAEKKLRFIDVQIQGSARNPVFNIFADSEKGITLGQCSDVTRLIQDELDMNDTFQDNYRLNVSSPGLDRPIKEDWEFQKNIGQTLKIKYTENESKQEVIGKLVNWTSENIEIESDKEKIIVISREYINWAKIQLQW